MVSEDSSEELPNGWTVQFNVLKTGRKIKYYVNCGNGKKFYSKDDFLRHIKAESTRLDQPQPTKSKSSIGTPTNNNLMHIVEYTNEHPEWLPHGWIVELRTRKSGFASGKIYKCYVDISTGHKFYSKPEVLRYLENMKQKSCTIEQKETLMSVLPENEVQFEKSSAEDLPAGWIKNTKITRNANGIRKDPYYIDPVDGYVFRSKRDVHRYLETGEISKHAIFPKKGHINEKTLPSSEAKRQKLKLAGQQLYTVKGTSDVGSTSSSESEFLKKSGGETVSAVTPLSVVTTIDIPSQENQRDNVKCNGAECKENSNANWSAQTKADVSDRNQYKNVSPVVGHGLLFPEADNKQEKNLPESGTRGEISKRESQNCLSKFSNQKILNLPRRFSKRLAGIEPELMGNSTFIVLAISEAGNEQEQNSPESGIKGDETYGERTWNSLRESNNEKGLNLHRRSSKCLDGVEPKPVVNLVSIVQALPKTIKSQKGEAMLAMGLTSDVLRDKRPEKTKAEPITEFLHHSAPNANNPLLEEPSNKRQKSDTTQSVQPKASVSYQNQCLIMVSANNGPVLTAEANVQQQQNSLQSGMKRKGQEKTQNNLSKSGDKKLKKGLNLPRRSSKRIAGLEPEVAADTGPNAQALQNAERSCKTEAILAGKASQQRGAESRTEFPNHALTDVKNQVYFEDMAISGNQSQVQETGKADDENSEPQLVPPFGEFWSDPCLEFAFKTLTGEIPVEITVENEMVSTPAADILDQRNSLMKTIDRSSNAKVPINLGKYKNSKNLHLPHQSPEQISELESEPTGSSISNARAIKMTGRKARKSSKVEAVLDVGSPGNLVAGASQQLQAEPVVAHAHYCFANVTTTPQPDPSNKRIESLDECNVIEKHLQKLETEKNGDKPDLQGNFSFGDYWSDPCFEFAFKTLTGAIPVDDNLPVQSYFQQQVDTYQIQRDGYFQQPVDTSQTLREGYFQQPVDTLQNMRDGSLALPDFGLPSYFQTDISLHFDASEKQLASQTRVPLNNPSFIPSGSVSLPSCSSIGSQQSTHLKENKGVHGKVKS